MTKKRRTIVYIDGFNLYHAIDELNQPHLKWVDLWSLSESLLRGDQELTAVKYYSAYARWLPPAFRRHREYVKALEARGVRATMSEFKERHMSCNNCSAQWKTHEEKETDVFLAVDIVEDLLTNAFDVAIAITADTDIRPAINKVSNTKGKLMLVMSPPKRYGRARSLKPSMEITKGRLAKHLLNETVLDKDGRTAARRPSNYAPPTT